MSSEQNKSLMRRYFEEAWNQGNIAVLDELVAPHFTNHSPAIPGLPPGADGLKPIFTAFRTAFPDLHFTIDDMISDGEKVVTRWTLQGTHQREFMGIPPTGKQVVVGGIEMERIVGGKIVEHWLQADNMGLMRQLGVIPSPGQ
jgi:steroid delta-isomerase-like uncharacterized protein